MAIYWLLGYFQKPFEANIDFVSWSIMKNNNIGPIFLQAILIPVQAQKIWA